MNVGKLPPDLLSKLLAKIKPDPRVLVGPRVGEDAAVIDFGKTLLVAKTDPITFATDLIGRYAVDVNANDIAVMGAEPKWFLATLLVPQTITPHEVEGIFDQILESLARTGGVLVGGHTEITSGLDRPILIGSMLGETAREKLITTSGASIGDTVIVTGGIAIEGTAILAREAADRLLAAGLPKELIERAGKLILEPGISVAPAVKAALRAGRVNSMHDPTEGGIATGLRELAVAANVGLQIDLGAIPVLAECREICGAVGLDPLGLIASGSLLLTAPEPDADRIMAALADEGIPAAVIGCVMPREYGLPGIPNFARDEIARFFEEA